MEKPFLNGFRERSIPGAEKERRSRCHRRRHPPGSGSRVPFEVGKERVGPRLDPTRRRGWERRLEFDSSSELDSPGIVPL